MIQSHSLDPSEEQLLTVVESGALHAVAPGELLSQLQEATQRTLHQGFAESITTAAGSVPLANDGAGSFSISGFPTVGNTLTATISSADPDGNATSGFTYSWQAYYPYDDFWYELGSSVSYVLQDGDQGKTIRLVVSYVDTQGFAETVTTSAVTVSPPNLVLSSSSAPSQAITGETIPISWSVINDSAVPTATSWQWYDEVYFSSNDIYGDGDDVILDIKYISIQSNPGNSYTVSTSAVLGSSAVGDGYVLFKANSLNWHFESDFADNLRVQPISIAAPNLVISQAVAPERATPGQFILLNYTIANIGLVSTKALFWYDKVVFSTNAIYGDGDDILLSELVVYQEDWAYRDFLLPLAPGEAYTISFGIWLPSEAIGNGFLLFKTDAEPSYLYPNGYQGEVDETDNVYVHPITIETPPPVNDGVASYAISGFPYVGNELTAALLTYDPDGPFSPETSIRWQVATETVSWSEVGTGLSYELKQEDAGKLIRVMVDYTDGEDFFETVYSESLLVRDRPVISIRPDNADQTEGDGGNSTYILFSFSVQRYGHLTYPSSVQWKASSSWTNGADGDDFFGNDLPSGFVNFAPGESIQTIFLWVSDDSTAEADENFIVTLSDQMNATIGQASANGVIRNNDPLVVNDGSATFSITGNPRLRNTLNAMLQNSDPDGPGDVLSYNWQTSTDGIGWSEVGTINSYQVAHADQGKQLRLVVSYTDGEGFLERVTTPSILVPLLPTLAITASTLAQLEGNIGSTAFAFTITRTGDLAGESRVSWEVAGVGPNPTTALDFAGGLLPAGTAVFAAGQSSLSLAVSVVGDGSLEPDESFRIELNSPVDARLSSTTSTAQFQILNDDQPASTYSFVSTPEPVYEGGTLHIAIITTNVETGRPLWWQISGTGITASDFSDGLLVGSTLIGSDGRAALTKTIAVDTLVESDEALEVRFFSDAARSKPVGNTLAITMKEPNVGVVTDGNDVITGTVAANIIIGVPIGSALRGRGSLDQLTGNGSADTFVLGDALGIYYDDATSGLGTSDLAVITDFTSGDRIQLSGAHSDYRLVSGRHNQIRGVRIDALNGSPGGGPEAIGFVQGATLASLNLTDPTQFLYV